MARLKLVIGPRRLSSWSLRAWLALRHSGLDFEEVVVRYDRPGGAARLAELSPSRRVPVLLVDDEPVWDSLAICEYLAEEVPALWPADRMARARARAASCEMHSGFRDLRTFLPMDVVARFDGPPVLLPRVEADLRRILGIWRSCRERWGEGGPFLFGRFSVADAMFAPVASRLSTYGVRLDAPARAYVEALAAMPAMRAWIEAATAEDGQEGLVQASPVAAAAGGPPGHAPQPAPAAAPPPPSPPPVAPPPAARPAPAAAPPAGTASRDADPEQEDRPPPIAGPFGPKAAPLGPVSRPPRPAPELPARPTDATEPPPGPFAAAGNGQETARTAPGLRPPRDPESGPRPVPAPEAMVPVRRNWLRGGTARAAAARTGGLAETPASGDEKTPSAAAEPGDALDRRLLRGPVVKPIGGGTRRRR